MRKPGTIGAPVFSASHTGPRGRQAEASAQGFGLSLEHAPVAELEEADAGVHGAGHEGAEGAIDPAEADEVASARAPRRIAEKPREGIAKARMRLEAVLEYGLVDAAAFLDGFKGRG